MMQRRLLLGVIAALYFFAVIGLAFVPGSPINGQIWCWQSFAFVPVGALLVLLMGRRRWWVALGFGVLGAAWLEAAQSVWMPAGYASAMDVVYDCTGVIAGVAIAWFATAPRTRPASGSLRAPEPHRVVAQARPREITQDRAF